MSPSATPEYDSWRSMIRRCENTEHRDFQHYGGRGIAVCERWRRDFAAFLADMGQRPPGTSIDRINNDGNYEPGNCRWATPLEQTRNRRNTKFVMVNGVKVPLAEAAEAAGIDRSALKNRILRGWTVEDALSVPSRGHGEGRYVGVSDAARAAGMKIGTLAQRIAAGWSMERAISTPVRPKRPARSMST